MADGLPAAVGPRAFQAPPLGLGVPPGHEDTWKEFWKTAWMAWQASECHLVPEALRLYGIADANLSCLNPSLSVLRHNVGTGSGSVTAIDATEDVVVSCFLPPRYDMSDNPCENLVIDVTEDQIEAVVSDVNPGFHWDNIKEHRQHIMVMSTGRCGSMSLHKLFQGSNLAAYHTYWFMASTYLRYEMMCRISGGNIDNFTGPTEWASTRAAEWLGEKPMIGMNHTDTVYAPVFAAIHPKSKFVYLRRDPEKVFNSFYKKDQWGGGAGQFRPILYNENMECAVPNIGTIDGIKFHIEFTEKYSRAFGRVMGDRWIEISSDKLFAQDKEEIAKLLEFTDSDIDLDYAVEHFSNKVNEKAHRCRS